MEAPEIGRLSIAIVGQAWHFGELVYEPEFHNEPQFGLFRDAAGRKIPQFEHFDYFGKLRVLVGRETFRDLLRMVGCWKKVRFVLTPSGAKKGSLHGFLAAVTGTPLIAFSGGRLFAAREAFPDESEVAHSRAFDIMQKLDPRQDKVLCELQIRGPALACYCELDVEAADEGVGPDLVIGGGK